MKFTIHLRKVNPGLTSPRLEKADLVLNIEGKIFKQEILSDRTLSENLLPAIDKLLKKAKLKTMPEFFVECDEDTSVISCNIARATIKGLSL